MNSLRLQENLKKYTHTESCPVRNVISRFSGKWSILVLCVLSENEATRFSAIGRALLDISPKVEYSLTELGRSLIPIIGELISWAADNYDVFVKND